MEQEGDSDTGDQLKTLTAIDVAAKLRFYSLFLSLPGKVGENSLPNRPPS